METHERIRKTVGRGRDKRPLERAFELRQMVIALRGSEPDEDGELIRKRVGRKRSDDASEERA